MNKTVGATVSALMLVLLAGCTSAPQAFTASGNISVNATGFLGDGGAGLPNDGDSCHSISGYTDISPGAQVVITDDTGKTVAVGALGAGKVVSEGLACEFPFKVKDVPSGSKFYKVEVTHRGGLQYTEKQLHTELALSIG